MRSFIGILTITILIAIVILAGCFFLIAGSESGKQLESSDLAIEASIGSKAVGSKNDIVLSSDGGQASLDEIVDATNNMNNEYDINEEVQIIKAQTKKEVYKSNIEEIQETQNVIAAGSLVPELNLENRGRVNRKQQVESQNKNLAVSADSPVELLDWWTDADKLFEKGLPALVVDVNTGKSYRVIRTYGSNHADVETLTPEDTAVMKEIWGGEWNWERRAVIVVVNGRKLAASATGMPHAGLDSMPEGEIVENRSGDFGAGTNLDQIEGNNMDGHFDIHFLNSKTHGTDKVDEKHQEMVQKAFGL